MKFILKSKKIIKIFICSIVAIGALNLNLVSADNTVVPTDIDLVERVPDISTLSSVSYAPNMDPNFVTYLLGRTASAWASGIAPASADELTIEKLADFSSTCNANGGSYNAGIKSLEGFQYMINATGTVNFYSNEITELPDFGDAVFSKMTSFSVHTNQISDLSPLANASFTALTSIYLYNNDIVDISVVNENVFPSLKILSMYNNEIKDISVLADLNLSILTGLYIHGNEISDISAFYNAEFTNLGTIHLGINGMGNNISDFGAFSTVKMPVITSFYAQFNPILDLSPLNNVFNDPNRTATTLELAVGSEAWTDLSAFRFFSNDAAAKVTTLSIRDAKNMTTLDGIDYIVFANVKTLNIDRNTSVQSIAALGNASFPEVTTFYLRGQESLKTLDGITPESFPALTALYAYGYTNTSVNYHSGIQDISALSNMTNLKTLQLYNGTGFENNNKIYDWTPLSNLTGITSLSTYGQYAEVVGLYTVSGSNVTVQSPAVKSDGSFMEYANLDEFGATISSEGVITFPNTYAGQTVELKLINQSVHGSLGTTGETLITRIKLTLMPRTIYGGYVSKEVIGEGDFSIDTQTFNFEGQGMNYTTSPKTGFELSNVVITGNTGRKYNAVLNGNNFTFMMPNESVVISCEFVAKSVPTYTINTTSTTNGTIGVENGMQFYEGEKVTINTFPTKSLTLNYEFALGNVFLNDIQNNPSYSFEKHGNSFSFIMPSSNVTIGAAFNSITSLTGGYITAGNLSNGSFSVPGGFIASGDKIYINTTPSTNYYLSDVSIPGASGVSTNGNTIIFTMPDTNVVVTPVFEQLEGGYIYKDSNYVIQKGDFAVPTGFQMADEIVSIVTTPEEGYTLNWVEVEFNGAKLDVELSGDMFSFVMPNGNVTVDLGFALGQAEVKTYFITPVISDLGTYSVPTAAVEGTTVNITNINATLGNVLEGVYVNGNQIEVIGNMATFIMPSENSVVEVRFISATDATYNIITTPLDGVDVIVDPTAAKPGTLITMTAINIPEDKIVTGFTILCNGSITVVDALDDVATTTMLIGEMVITPVVSDKQTSFEVIPSPYDSFISTFEFKDGESVAENGEVVSFKIIPDDTTKKAAYIIYTNIKTGFLSSLIYPDSDGNFNITINEGDVMVYAYYVENTYNISTSTTIDDKDYNNGYLVVNTPNVGFNEEYSVSVYPNPGYRLKEIIKNTTNISSISMYSEPDIVITNESTYLDILTVAKDLVLTAIFEVETYSVSVADTINGSVAVSTNGLNVSYGTVITVDTLPNEGYILGELYYEVDGNKISIPLTSDTQGKFYMSNYDTIIYATFVKNSYDITINDDIVGGEIFSSVESSLAGEEVTISTTVDENYLLEQIIITNIQTGENITLVDDKFIMPEANVFINASFVKEGYNVTITGDFGGTPVVDKLVVSVGDVINITPNPLPGYKVESITATVDGVVTDLENNTSYKVFDKYDVAIHLTYVQVEYTINVSSNAGGSVEVAQSAKFGDEVTVTITPDVGYEVTLVEITGDGTSTNFGSNNKFVMLDEDVVVKVEFSKFNYYITPTPGLGNVDITVFASDNITEISSAEYNQEVYVNYAPHDGYNVIKTYYIEEGTSTVMRPFINSFIMPASNVYVTATMDTIDYEINLVQTVGNFVGLKDNVLSTSKSGFMVEVEVVIEIDPTIQLTGLEITNKTNGDVEIITGTIFAMPSYDIDVKPIFSNSVYSVKVETNLEGGKIAIADNKVTAIAGETLEIDVTTYEGYSFVCLAIYEEDGSLVEYAPDGQRTLTMINSNAIVTALFTVNNYDITIKASADCIDGTFNVTTNPAESASFGSLVTVTPANVSNANIDKVVLVKVDGLGNEIENGRTTLSAPYVFEMPAYDVIIEYTYVNAGFQINTFAISEDGATGTITTQPNGYADKDTVVKVIATPDGSNTISGYNVKGIDGSFISVDDSNIDSGILYFVMPEMDVNIQIIFSLKDYDIKVSDSLVDGGFVKVYSNESKTNEVTSAKEGQKLWIETTTYTGYHLQSLSVIPDNIAVAMMSNIITTTHIMTASDVTITPTWIAKDTFVSITTNNGGIASVGTSYNTPGSTVSLSITPDTGYALDEITLSTGGSLSTGEIVLNVDKYEFTMPDTSVLVEVTFKTKVYTLDLNYSGGNSTASIVGNINEANYNDVVSLDIALANGEVVESATISYQSEIGTVVKDIKNNTFIMPNADVEIDIIFTGKTYTIDSATFVGGTIEVYLASDIGNPINTAKYGDEIVINVTPDNGYVLDGISYLSSLSSNLELLQLNSDGLSANYTMEASSILLYPKLSLATKYTANIHASQDLVNGNVSLSSRTGVEGEVIKINAFAKTGYEISNVVFYDENDDVYVEESYQDLTFEMPNHNVYISVEFTATEFEIISNDIIYNDFTDPSAVIYDQIVNFTPKNLSGSVISEVQIITVESNRYIIPSVTNGIYSFAMPLESVSIIVTYTASTVSGTVQFDPTQGVAILSKTTTNGGNELSVYTYSKTGYELESISIVYDGITESLEIVDSFNNTFTAPYSDYTIIVTFSEKMFSLTSATDMMLNGTLEFLVGGYNVTNTEVQENTSVSVLVKPNDGYQFHYYTENKTPTSTDFFDESFSNNIGKTDSYVFSYVMPSFDVELYAYFAPISNYSVASTNNENGDLTITVIESENTEKLLVTAIPESGYEVSVSDIVNVETGDRTSFTFDENNTAMITKPDSNIEVDVSFDLMTLSNEVEEENTNNNDQPVYDSEVDNEDVNLNVDSSVVVTTGVLTSDSTQSVFGVLGLASLASIVAFVTKRKTK